MGKGKQERRIGTGGSPVALPLAVLMATTAMVAPGYVRANPTGGVVNGGTATIGGEGTDAVTIDQTSDRAIIDWASFDIGAGESTQFNQPAGGVALNRIGGATASSILGSLGATGTIFLINPNGVVFGAGSTVNVGSLVATTAGIANADFMAGNYNFDAASAVAGATIENAGTITVADTGLAALVAPNVINSGTITAELGRVELAGAETFTVDLAGDGLLTFDTGIATSVTQSGDITADGGYVRLSAGALTDLVGGTINMSGTIQALTASSQNGTIVLSGASNSTVTVDGDLDAGAAGAIFVNAGTGGVTAGGDLTAGTLGIVSDGDATLNGAGNAIGTLAADVDGNLTLSNSAALTVGSVDDQAGGTLDGVAADNVALTAAGNITVADAAPVTAASGDITLTTSAAGSLSLGENLSAASGDIFLTAGTGGVALANGATLSAVGLAITSGGSLDLSGTHAVGTLAVDAAGENLTFDSSIALTIGTVGTVEGVTAANVDVSSGGNLTVASTIDGANVTLTTGDSGALAINADMDAGSSDVTLDAGTGGITTGTDAVIIAQDLSVTSDGAASLGDGHTVAGLSGTVDGDLTFSVTGGLTLDGITAQDLTIGAGGNLTVASAVTADNVSLTTGSAGTLAVNADIDAGPDDVTLDAGTGGVTVATGVTIAAQDLDVTSDGAAALGDGHDIDGFSAVVADALTFGASGDLSLDGVEASSVTVGTGGDLMLNGNVDAGTGAISLEVDGAISHAAGVLTAASLSVDSGGDATLGGNHAVSDLSSTAGGDLSFGASGDLEVGVVTATNVDISAADGLSVTAAVTADGGDGDIALAAGAGGITSGNGLLKAQDLSVTSGGAASLGTGHDIDGLSTGVTGVDGTLAFGSANALDLDGVSADGMELTADSFSLNDGVTATAGDIVLRAIDGGVDTNGNLFSAAGLGIESTGAVDLSGAHDVDVLAVDAGSGDVAFESTDALEVGEIDAIAGVSGDGVTLTAGGALDLAEDVDGADGDVSLTATGGGIGSSGGAITGDALTIVAGGDVDLSDNASNVDSVTATLTGHDFAFLDADTISLGAIDAANIEATATAGDLTVGSALSAGNIDLAAGDGIALDRSLTATGTIFMDAGAGGIALANGMTLAAAELGIRSGGALDLSGDHSVGTLAVDAAGQDLDFSATGALEIGSVTGIGGSTIDGVAVDSLTLDTGGALDLASDMTAADATLSVVGDITTSGGVAIVGTLDIDAAEDLTLDGANDVDSLQATLTGALEFADEDGLILDGVTATGADVTADGALTLASDLDVGTGTVTFDAGGDILSTGGSVTAATLDIDAAEDVTLDGDVDSLTADALGTVTFDDSDDVTVDVTAGSVNVSAGGLLTVIGATEATVGNLELASATKLDIDADLTAADDLILTAGAGGIDATGATLTADRLALTSGGALVLTGTHDVDTIAVNAAGQALAFTNAGSLTVGAVDGVAGISAASADLTASAGNITLASALNVGTGAATLTATDGDIASSTGSVTAGLLDVDAGGNIDLDGDVTTLSASAGGSLAFADANALTVADASGDSVDISAGGLLTTVGAVAATSGDLSLTGSGLAIGADLDAAGNDILLTAGTGGIDVTAGATMTADGLGIVSGGPIDLAGPHDISTIAVDAAGQALDFASSGPLSIGTVGGIAGITAGSANLAAGSGDLTVDSGIQAGAVSLRSGPAGGVIVNASVDSGGGTMVLDAGTGGVTSNGAGLAAGRLAIISDGTVDLTHPNRIGVLAVRAPGRAFSFVNDGTLRVGTVAGVYGIDAGPVDLTATGGDLIFDANHFMGGRNILRAPDGRAIFNGRIDGGHDLYVLALRDVFFNAAVGAQAPLRGVIVGSSYDFPPGVDLADLTSDTILAAADAVGDTDGNIVVNGLFRTTGAVVMTADLIHGSVTTQPHPNRAFDVGALFVSGRWATVYGKVAQFHHFGAAYEARRRRLLDLPFNNPNYPIPEDFQMNDCTIGTICPDPLAVIRLMATRPIESFIGQPLLVSPVARMIGNDQELFSNSGNEEIW
ncbi:filamentous hemagglutinin N-terminal domain-containing protein [Inquilinus sp. CAU 1745]|uniref:two-partner secretion domain-containing protein n=1 Tax=Inquilinus sp. CAU 1745 TaxID=3140369 RepID=UPI00325BD544